MNKTYRFRLKSTKTQAEALLRQAGMSRFVFNWALDKKRGHYKETGETLANKNLSAMLTSLKQEEGTKWLREANAQSLQQSLRDLDRAFQNFFSKRSRFPKFKSRHKSPPSFRIPQRVRVQDGKVYCPKIGWIRLRQSQEIVGKTKSATFKQDAQGHWYVTLVSEFDMPDAPLSDPKSCVGIDLGLEAFIATSDGVKVAPLKLYRRSQAKLAREQRSLSRKQKGSNNRQKQRRKVAKVHAKIRNQRQDFLHKLSTSLVAEYDLIAVEDLNIKGLAKSKLAKSILDAGWSEFIRQLEYKALWNRKHFVKIDRFYPSSKGCSECGAIQESMPLSVRKWVCDCGATHDRDVNAAKNILRAGRMAVGQTVSACGADVRQLDSVAVGSEARILPL